MDMLKIKTSFMRDIVSKLIKKAVDRQLGINSGISLNDLEVSFDNSDKTVMISLNVDAALPESELWKLVAKI